MAEKIEFDIKVGVNELDKAFSNAITGSKKLSDTVSTALGTFGGNIALKGFNLLGDAVGEATGFIKDSIKASSEQEDALNKLAQALRTTGSFSQEAVDNFSAFASELQRTSIFGDEVVIGQIAIAKSLGATNEQAKNLVQAAANLAATFGGSLEENVSKLGKTLSGVVSRDLKAAIPELQGLSKSALDAGEAIDIVNRRFSGAASSQLDTYSGSVVAASNAFSDLQEEIGSVLVDVLNLKEANDFLKSVYETLTEKVLGFKDSLSRGSEGFKETEGSINRLSAKYASLTEDIERQKAIIEENAGAARTSVRAAGEVVFARDELAKLTKEYDALFKTINSFKPPTEQAPQGTSGKGDSRTAQEILAAKDRAAQIIAIESQLGIERQNAAQEFENASIINEQVRNEAELQRILEFDTLKKEVELTLAEDKAKLIDDEALRNAELIRVGKQRELDFTNIANKNIIEAEKLKNKAITNQFAYVKKYEDQSNAERVANLQSTFGQIATLSQSSNSTLAAIGKAAAISNATIDGYVAVNKALASAPPPVNYALAAAVGVAAAANVSRIAGVKGFANGGIIGATQGPDNQVATVRTGEMVLNAQQQEKLFNAINSGSFNNGDIIIQVDGRTIASVVRDQVKQGFKL